MIHRLLCAALLALASWPALAGVPSDLVEARSGAVLKTLVAQREAFRKDPAALDAYIRSELDSLFDQEYAARLVLGRHARSQTPAQISAFADALRDNLVRKYGGALLDFDPAVSAVVRSETPLRNGQMVRVATEFQRRAGAPVPTGAIAAASSRRPSPGLRRRACAGAGPQAVFQRGCALRG